MAAAAARLLLPRATRAAASSSALPRRPLEFFPRCHRSLEPALLRPPSTVFRRHLSDATLDAQALDTRVPATVITGFLGSGKKGPIAEKLDEQIARDREHLRHLISICEEQRQVGETALNDTSSRSHQIIRLTVESRLREVSGCVKSFVASILWAVRLLMG